MRWNCWGTKVLIHSLIFSFFYYLTINAPETNLKLLWKDLIFFSLSMQRSLLLLWNNFETTDSFTAQPFVAILIKNNCRLKNPYYQTLIPFTAYCTKIKKVTKIKKDLMLYEALKQIFFKENFLWVTVSIVFKFFHDFPLVLSRNGLFDRINSLIDS